MNDYLKTPVGWRMLDIEILALRVLYISLWSRFSFRFVVVLPLLTLGKSNLFWKLAGLFLLTQLPVITIIPVRTAEEFAVEALIWELWEPMWSFAAAFILYLHSNRLISSLLSENWFPKGNKTDELEYLDRFCVDSSSFPLFSVFALRHLLRFWFLDFVKLRVFFLFWTISI